MVGFCCRGIANLLVGSVGLRVIGVPAILDAIFRPNPESALRFILAFFVVLGLFIVLMFSFTPQDGHFDTTRLAEYFACKARYVAGCLQSSSSNVVSMGRRPRHVFLVAAAATRPSRSAERTCDAAASSIGGTLIISSGTGNRFGKQLQSMTPKSWPSPIF